MRGTKRLDDDINPNIINISQIKSIDFLIRQYPNELLIPQFVQMQKQYPNYRAVRGDGNCFYRAIAFLYLREANFRQFSNVFQNIRNVCKGYPLEFESQSFQMKLQRIYQQFLMPIQYTSGVARQKQLSSYFNKSFVFDTIMILYFRSLNYLYIQSNAQRYGNFIENLDQIHRIKMYGNDSEGVQYRGMADALNITLNIQITDQYRLNSEIYNQGQFSKSYDIFFRPGHFDILYHKHSQFLKNSKSIPNKMHQTLQRSPQKFRAFERQYNFKENESKFKVQNNYPSIPRSYAPSIFTSRASEKPGIIPRKSSAQNPFLTMNKLRLQSSGSKGKNQQQNLMHQKNSQKKTSFRLIQKRNFQKDQSSTQIGYKAWSSQKSSQNQSSKIKLQALYLTVFLLVLAYFLVKF